MVEVQDTVIKLFGTNITLPENGKMAVSSGCHYAMESSCLATKKVDIVGEEECQKEDHNRPILKDDESDTSNSEKKTLKKPDKILPCPRCNSMDTKFCYYNNYNINQPRHFCRSCQRYWTSGGTMRNVPVGSGRRKNKSQSASYYLQNHTRTTTVSDEEALELARVNGNILGPNFNPNASVLSFYSSSQLPHSRASVVSLEDKRASNGTENGNDFYIGSSIPSSKSGVIKEIQDLWMQNIHRLPSQVPYLSGLPWPFYLSNLVAPPISGSQNPVYATPYWNSNVQSGWSYPWLTPRGISNQTPVTPLTNSGFPKFPSTLGKHSRDGDLLTKEETCERPNPVLHTLRIDGPDEAEKSSTCRGGLFKGFHAKSNEKKHITEEASPVMQANPAAMGRSLSFMERA